jgi:hypothetical protein
MLVAGELNEPGEGVGDMLVGLEYLLQLLKELIHGDPIVGTETSKLAIYSLTVFAV